MAPPFSGMAAILNFQTIAIRAHNLIFSRTRHHLNFQEITGAGGMKPLIASKTFNRLPSAWLFGSFTFCQKTLMAVQYAPHLGSKSNFKSSSIHQYHFVSSPGGKKLPEEFFLP